MVLGGSLEALRDFAVRRGQLRVLSTDRTIFRLRRFDEVWLCSSLLDEGRSKSPSSSRYLQTSYTLAILV